MSALSDYLENELLDHLLRNSAYSRPANLYFALFTGDPGESGNTGEVSGGSYARAAVTNNNVTFPLCATTGTPVKTNGVVVTFPTASASWGTVTHWAIYDDDGSPSGNMIAHGALAAPNTVAIGKTVRIAAGAWSISATNAANGGMTNFAQRKLLDHVFGGPTYTPAASIYTGLGTALSGETLTEWADTSYGRQLTAFDAASGGVCVNTAAETYSASVAVSATLTHYGVWDDVSAGNLLFVGSLATSRVPAVTDSVTAAIGTINPSIE
jgi:hypothetical protein